MKRFLAALVILVAATSAQAWVTVGNVMASTSEVTLQWEPSIDHDYITGYRLYYGSSTGQYTTKIEVGKVTTYTISLPDGTYFMALTAYDDRGLESAYSNEVSTTIKTSIRPPKNLIIFSVTILNGTAKAQGR